MNLNNSIIIKLSPENSLMIHSLRDQIYNQLYPKLYIDISNELSANLERQVYRQIYLQIDTQLYILSDYRLYGVNNYVFN
jgi:hypothetical protein